MARLQNSIYFLLRYKVWYKVRYIKPSSHCSLTVIVTVYSVMFLIEVWIFVPKIAKIWVLHAYDFCTKIRKTGKLHCKTKKKDREKRLKKVEPANLGVHTLWHMHLYVWNLGKMGESNQNVIFCSLFYCQMAIILVFMNLRNGKPVLERLHLFRLKGHCNCSLEA